MIRAHPVRDARGRGKHRTKYLKNYVIYTSHNCDSQTAIYNSLVISTQSPDHSVMSNGAKIRGLSVAAAISVLYCMCKQEGQIKKPNQPNHLFLASRTVTVNRRVGAEDLLQDHFRKIQGHRDGDWSTGSYSISKLKTSDCTMLDMKCVARSKFKEKFIEA